MRSVASRDEFPTLLTECGLTHSAVEVGTQEGVYAEHLLTHWPGFLTCVDPWRYQSDWTDDPANVAQREQDQRYARCKDRLAPFLDAARCRLSRLPSVEAAADYALFHHPKPEFVYLDARHDYAHITQDIAAWWPLVAKGGLLAGHDYHAHIGWGVIQAVNEFVERERVTLHLTNDRHFPSWFVQKPAP